MSRASDGMAGWTFWALEAVSVACAIHLWARATGSPAKKVLWTLIVLVPVMGPLLYGGTYDTPREQDDDQRATESDTDSDDD